MSNTQVGNIYQQIIADVVESSRVDFEEGGVDEQVLEELRQVRASLSIHPERCHRSFSFISTLFASPILSHPHTTFLHRCVPYVDKKRRG